jgi:myosin heavy subunit
MDWATQTDNIALHLSQNKDDDIVHILQERYTLQRPVTFIGNDSCVVLGLHETGLSNQYAAHAEQQMSGDTVHILPPHILQVASESFNEMVHNQQNQTILFL